MAADPDSAEKSTSPKNAVNDHIIREHPPAIDVNCNLSAREDPPAGSSAAAAERPQGVAQLEEPAVRNGEDTGSKPVPLIEPPRGNSNGDATHLIAGDVPPSATAYAGGAHELQPTFSETPPATYNYKDAAGDVVYRVLRYSSTDVRAQRPGKNGSWLEGLRIVPRLLYGADRFAGLKGKVIYLCQDERDTETAWALNVEATCWFEGAYGWRPEFLEFFRDKYVIILPHNDDPGRAFAAQALDDIKAAAASSVILSLPNMDEHGDLTDFVAAGGTTDDLYRLAQEAYEAAAPRPSNLEADEPPMENVPLPDAAAAGPANGKPSKPIEPAWSIVTKCFADIEREEINWLWNGMWINHTLNMLIGPPGVGKTFVACHLAAAVSSGVEFPDGGGKPPIGDVVYCCTEDSLSAAIRPRLEEAGAKIQRCHTWLAKERIDRSGQHVEEPLSLTDVEALIAKIDEMPDLRLIIFDPVMAYMGNAEANDNQDVRRILEGIRNIAESKRICVLLVSHLKKGVSQAINATMGAQAFTAVPRSVYMLQKDPEDPEKRTRCLSPVKNNSGPDHIGKKFRLDFGPTRTGSGHIVWDAVPDERSADEISMATIAKNSFTGRESNEEKSQTKNELAFFEVLDALSNPAGTWVPSSEIKEKLGWNGLRFSSLQWNLERSGRIEVRKGEKPMPGGGVQRGGRDEVRRPEIVVPWSPG